MMRRLLLLASLLVIVVPVACVAGLLVTRHFADAKFYDGYVPEAPLHAQEGSFAFVQGKVEAFHQVLPARYRKQPVSFVSSDGDRVPALLTLPLETGAPAPAIVLLHGSHQEKEFVEEICTPFNEAGFAMVCFDQYMRGERKIKGGVVATAMAFRDRCRKTVHDTQRLIDYLQSRPDIDGNRIYLVGASYGAITGTVAVARDKRIRAAVLVVGGGNFKLMAQAPEVRRELPRWLWPLAGSLMQLVAGPAEPILHAPGTALTPVLMLNGSNDMVITPESGKALFAALGEPKEIRWYPVNHPDREEKGEEVIKMLEDGRNWLVEQDASFRAVEAKPAS